MKVKYEVSKGKFIDVEVTEAQAEVLKKMKREKETHERKFKRRTLKETSLDYLYDEYEWEAEDKTIDIQGNIERKELAKQVQKAISCLTEKQQLLVRDRYYENKSIVEIASKFEVTKSAISHQFQTIHKRLKSLLKNFLK